VVLKRFFPQPHTFVDRNGKCVCDRSEINVASSRRAGAVPAAPRCRWPASATSSCAHRHRHMLRRIAGMTNSQECWLSSSNRRFDNLEFDVFLMCEIETVLICFFVKEQHLRTPILARVFEPKMQKRDARRKYSVKTRIFRIAEIRQETSGYTRPNYVSAKMSLELAAGAA